MESPYQPPQELEANDYAPMPGAPGVFQFAPDEQQTVGKLAKYLNDIGGLLIFVAIISILLFLFTAGGMFMVNAPGGPSSLMAMMSLQLLQQLANVVCLFAIGLCMRRAASPLREAASTMDGHMPSVMRSMFSLRTLYGWHIAYIGLGLLFAVATTLLSVSF